MLALNPRIMGSSDVNHRLKKACVDTLQTLLSEHQDVRKEAETQVQHLGVTEGRTCLVD